MCPACLEIRTNIIRARKGRDERRRGDFIHAVAIARIPTCDKDSLRRRTDIPDTINRGVDLRRQRRGESERRGEREGKSKGIECAPRKTYGGAIAVCFSLRGNRSPLISGRRDRTRRRCVRARELVESQLICELWLSFEWTLAVRETAKSRSIGRFATRRFGAPFKSICYENYSLIESPESSRSIVEKFSAGSPDLGWIIMKSFAQGWQLSV